MSGTLAFVYHQATFLLLDRPVGRMGGLGWESVILFLESRPEFSPSLCTQNDGGRFSSVLITNSRVLLSKSDGSPGQPFSCE